MSKRAEQKALEAYPRSEKYTSSQRLIINDLRDGFIQGYEQAEKDIALTWKDVRNLCDCFMDVGLESNLPARSKEFYTEVLNRFNKSKEKK